MSRPILTLCALLLVITTGIVVGGRAATPASAYSGPNAVAIPYFGETTVSPATGWLITDCAPVVAATPLVTACTAEEFTLTATSYDPEFEPLTISVPMSNGRSTATVSYVVTLAPPEPPEIGLTSYPYPTASGATLLLPISDLDIECPVCTTGGAMQVVNVAPASAGSAAAADTHLVVRSVPSFAGNLEVTIRFADSFGFFSGEETITIPFTDDDERLTAMSVYRPLSTTTPTSLSLSAFVVADEIADVTFIGCGAAIHGTVVCSDDGNVQYIPFEESQIDQFSFHVELGGSQATGSVTLVAEGVGLPVDGYVPADRHNDPDDEDGTATPIVPRMPPGDDVAGAAQGVFAPLVRLLDRVGAQ